MESRGTKTALWLTVVGALLGGTLSTWLAPKVIAWYFNPPASTGINCVEPIEWALGKLQLAQAVGILGGAIVGIVLFYAVVRQRLAAPAK